MSTTTSNSTTTTTNKQVRTVGFAKRTRIYLIESLADFSDAEIDAVWITPEENKASLADVAKNVQAMRRNAAEDDSQGICFRGLEALQSASILQTSKSNKEKHVDAVLDEQDRQWEEAEISHEGIAKVSEVSSEQARQRAVAKGTHDNIVANCAKDTLRCAI